ncbi:sugar transferase [Reinekea marinisedimentorum]|uniref:Lipopolysaccharide/colanic/teichoic acid biosynthesis glycosyltransferase n=1 Tax=Reinekea marinisedimentorum TaxID=230495 RepID=A0A4R3I8E1_9GAMM|nr:sugar transferase [Reinekea marinisedimentorum]TCS42384.1 lipopolysaccharide/colanic/teichoic acid biosynthesis glycosyltransferase [Reinekea marinisedimentorum]
MNLFSIIWFSALALVVYHHLVYPLIMKLVASKIKATPAQPKSLADQDLPPVTVIVPCYNESETVVDKLYNLQFLDYPEDKLRVLLVDDGSSDDTVRKISSTLSTDEFAGKDFQLLVQPRNGGKVAAINAAMRKVSHGVVVLSDTSALVSIDALKRAAGLLADDSIGVVCATYKFLQPGSEGEDRYWQYQTQMKHTESLLGSTLGAHGALYAFHAESFKPLAADTINDDFILPMSICRSGKRCVYDTEMIAVELECASNEQDFNRRQRIAAGNFQQAMRLVDLLHPKYGWSAWNFASGKWMRVFMPFILLVLWLASLFNPVQNPLIELAAMVQTVGYSVLTMRHFFPDFSWPRLVNVAYYLVSAYVASGLGAVRYIINPETFTAWARADGQSLEEYGYSRSTFVAKRFTDVVVAGAALLFTLPLWPLIALAIKLESKGPVFFRQLRIGRAMPDKTELFHMIKFRTMVTDAEAKSGAVWAANNDPRITRIGNFLRKTRLDELPQLFNVLKGDMSLIGPRPERPGIARDLNRALPFYAERTYFVPPGITGLAQVNQGYDTCLDDVKNKLLYDHAYALTLSNPLRWLKADVHVAFKTVWVMVAGRGQ